MNGIGEVFYVLFGKLGNILIDFHFIMSEKWFLEIKWEYSVCWDWKKSALLWTGKPTQREQWADKIKWKLTSEIILCIFNDGINVELFIINEFHG